MCGVCDTPELWRGAKGLCVRIRACAGAAESLHTYTHILLPAPVCACHSTVLLMAVKPKPESLTQTHLSLSLPRYSFYFEAFVHTSITIFSNTSFVWASRVNSVRACTTHMCRCRQICTCIGSLHYTACCAEYLNTHIQYPCALRRFALRTKAFPPSGLRPIALRTAAYRPCAQKRFVPAIIVPFARPHRIGSFFPGRYPDPPSLHYTACCAEYLNTHIQYIQGGRMCGVLSPGPRAVCRVNPICV